MINQNLKSFGFRMPRNKTVRQRTLYSMGLGLETKRS